MADSGNSTHDRPAHAAREMSGREPASLICHEMTVLELRKYLIGDQSKNLANVSKPVDLTEDDKQTWKDLVETKESLEKSLLVRPPGSKDLCPDLQVQHKRWRRQVSLNWEAEQPLSQARAFTPPYLDSAGNEIFPVKINSLQALYSLNSQVSAINKLRTEWAEDSDPSATHDVHHDFVSRLADFQDGCARLRDSICGKYDLGAAAESCASRLCPSILQLFVGVKGLIWDLSVINQEYIEKVRDGGAAYEHRYEEAAGTSEVDLAIARLVKTEDRLRSVMETFRDHGRSNPIIDKTRLATAWEYALNALTAMRSDGIEAAEQSHGGNNEEIVPETHELPDDDTESDQGRDEGYPPDVKIPPEVEKGISKLSSLVTEDYLGLLDALRATAHTDSAAERRRAVTKIGEYLHAYRPATRAPVRQRRTFHALAKIASITTQVAQLELACVLNTCKPGTTMDEEDLKQLLNSLDEQYQAFTEKAGYAVWPRDALTSDESRRPSVLTVSDEDEPMVDGHVPR